MSATIRITVLHLGGREICAEDARDMGIRNGETIGRRLWELAEMAEHEARRG